MSTATQNPNAVYWHDARVELALGCTTCDTQGTCGGLRTLHPAFDCTRYCRCQDTENCPFVCPCNPETFVARIREVASLKLATIPSAPPTLHRSLPLVVPLLYHGSKRIRQLRAPAVALPLHALFSSRTGRPRFLRRRELLRRFRISSRAAIVLSGVAQDRSLEAYWSAGRAADLPRYLAQLKPALITTPNFSLFGDVPRWDNLYNMKRIAICWHELATAGIPAALHVNARTDHDWDRWIQFLRSHPEICSIAFEFKTGPASPERGKWHARHLCRVAERVGRPLRLVTRGGYRYLADFLRSFKDVSLLASTPAMKAVKRRQLVWHGLQRPRWVPCFLPRHRSIDMLLQHNVDEYAKMVAHQVHWPDEDRSRPCPLPAARQLELPLAPPPSWTRSSPLSESPDA